MKQTFSCETYAPSLGTNLRFNEITINHTKNIIKYIQNSDDSGLSAYFEELLTELCVNGDVHTLDKLDKLCILTCLRAISIGPVLQWTFTCDQSKKEFTYKKDTLIFLKTLAELNNLYTNNKITINDNFKLYLKYPKQLYYESPETLITDCIYNIKIDNKEFQISSIPLDERKNILNGLPNFVMHKINHFLQKEQHIFNDINFLNIDSPFIKDHKLTQVNLGITNNSFLEILKLIYNMNIDEIYNLIYIMITKLGYSGTYVENNMPFAEAVIYINKYMEEIKKKEENTKSLNQNNNQIPIPLSIPYTGIE